MPGEEHIGGGGEVTIRREGQIQAARKADRARGGNPIGGAGKNGEVAHRAASQAEVARTSSNTEGAAAGILGCQDGTGSEAGGWQGAIARKGGSASDG